MTKVYCCNFMEQIYHGLSTERKLVGPFRLSYKTVVKDDCLERTRALKMIVWKEQDPEAELSVKHLKLSISHYFLKSLLQPFLVWAKTSSFNISHFSRSFNLVRHQDLREKSLSF